MGVSVRVFVSVRVGMSRVDTPCEPVCIHFCSNFVASAMFSIRSNHSLHSYAARHHESATGSKHFLLLFVVSNLRLNIFFMFCVASVNRMNRGEMCAETNKEMLFYIQTYRAGDGKNALKRLHSLNGSFLINHFAGNNLSISTIDTAPSDK